jgi:hypothetical protein
MSNIEVKTHYFEILHSSVQYSILTKGPAKGRTTTSNRICIQLKNEVDKCYLFSTLCAKLYFLP